MGDLMVWPHPLNVIQFAKSSYYYNNLYLYCSNLHQGWNKSTPDQVTIVLMCILCEVNLAFGLLL